MKIKRLIASTLVGAMAFSLAACGSSSSSSSSSGDATSSDAEATVESTAEEGTLVVGLYNSLDSLNPWTSGQITKDMVTFCLYETLASAETGSTDLDYILMKDYTQVDDYTFDVEIYDYITDAEGNNITAADVVFSFGQYMENWATTVESIEATGDYTFEIVLNTAAEGSFEYIVCEVPIASETAYNNSPDQFSTTSCGTMPYVCEGGADYVSGSTIICRKTDSYWQTEEDLIYEGSVANADTIEFDILTESTQLALAIENGTVQVAQFIDASLLDEVSTTDGVELAALAFPEDRGIMFCMTEDSIFYDNLALRQAILYAIDNETVAEACGYGYGEASVVTCGNSELTIGYDESWESDRYHYDPEKAKELLEEANYNGETIRLLCNDNAAITMLWQTVQANLQAVGINAELNVCEGTTYGTYRDGTSGQYELAYAGPGNAGYATTDLWDTLFNRNNYSSGCTWAGLYDDELQALYDALTEPNGYTQENVNAFYEYITENALYYQIYDLDWYAAYNTSAVESYFVDRRGFILANTVVLAE
ncbi:MAG: ABC transporter substrate-binding protein [Clostridiales bacterium]|nr:ABC transporter substrate-binding protein [Clostridiales bacterium]